MSGAIQTVANFEQRARRSAGTHPQSPESAASPDESFVHWQFLFGEGRDGLGDSDETDLYRRDAYVYVLVLKWVSAQHARLQLGRQLARQARPGTITQAYIQAAEFERRKTSAPASPIYLSFCLPSYLLDWLWVRPRQQQQQEQRCHENATTTSFPDDAQKYLRF